METEIENILETVEALSEREARPGDVGDYFLRLEALKRTRELLREKYRSDEPNLWRTATPAYFLSTLGTLRFHRHRRRNQPRFPTGGMKARAKDMRVLRRAGRL